MTSAAWIPFLILCVTVELTPGPNMAYLAILSMSAGRRAGFFAIAGIALGLAIVGSLAAFGAATIVTNSPMLSRLLVVAGFLYLLWLAWDTWKEPVSVAPAAQHRHGQYFVRGLITNLLNPKAFLFYVMVLPGFVSGQEHPVSYAFFLTAIAVAIATVVHVSIVLLGSRCAPYLNQPARRRVFRNVMALMLVAIAIWFAVTNLELVFKKVA
jgi:threonine/homoserine/homoserine lactone efflux protein